MNTPKFLKAFAVSVAYVLFLGFLAFTLFEYPWAGLVVVVLAFLAVFSAYLSD